MRRLTPPASAKRSRKKKSTCPRRAWSTKPRSTRSRRCRATRKSRRLPPSRKLALPPRPKLRSRLPRMPFRKLSRTRPSPRLTRARKAKMKVKVQTLDAKAGVDILDVKDGKTKELREKLGKLGFGKTALVIDGDALNVGFARASSNLESINLLSAVGANVYDIMRHETLVLTRAAVEKLEARFNG